MKKLAILSTHPIQYNAPLFRMLHNDSNFEIHVFYSKTWQQVKYDPDFQKEVVWDLPLDEGYPHHTFNGTSKSGRQKLLSCIKEWAPDALLVFGWNFPGHLKVMRALHGEVPIGFRGDSHLLNPQSAVKRLLRLLFLRYVYRHVDLAFSVGSANTAYFEACGVRNSNIQLAPHAVDVEYWTAHAEVRTQAAMEWRQELGIHPREIVIGYAGKLEAIKQVNLVLEAFKKAALPEVHFIIAGSGPLEAELQERAKNIPNVHFLGFVNQSSMPIFYRMVNALVLASSSETWGLCINEAILCGTRIIVSNRVGCGEDILAHNDKLGTMAPWDDPSAWERAIAQVKPDRLSENDVIGFAQSFNYSILASQLHRLVTQSSPY